MKLWKWLVLAPFASWVVACAASRVDSFDTANRMICSPGRAVIYDAGPVSFVYTNTRRTGLSVELWPYWRTAVILYRRPPGT